MTVSLELQPGYLQETALIVNPRARHRAALQRYFAGADYHVLATRTTDEALALCRNYEGAIHILVTDVELSGASGWKLAESAAKIRPGLIVLFLSPESLGNDGANFVPKKPPSMLFEVTQALSRKAQAQTRRN